VTSTGRTQRLDEYLNVKADQPHVTHRSAATGFVRGQSPRTNEHFVKTGPAARV